MLHAKYHDVLKVTIVATRSIHVGPRTVGVSSDMSGAYDACARSVILDKVLELALVTWYKVLQTCQSIYDVFAFFSCTSFNKADILGRIIGVLIGLGYKVNMPFDEVEPCFIRHTVGKPYPANIAFWHEGINLGFLS